MKAIKINLRHSLRFFCKISKLNYICQIYITNLHKYNCVIYYNNIFHNYRILTSISTELYKHEKNKNLT